MPAEAAAAIAGRPVLGSRPETCPKDAHRLGNRSGESPAARQRNSLLVWRATTSPQSISDKFLENRRVALTARSTHLLCGGLRSSLPRVSTARRARGCEFADDRSSFDVRSFRGEQANFPAEQPAPGTYARFPVAHAYPRRARDHRCPPAQRPSRRFPEENRT